MINYYPAGKMTGVYQFFSKASWLLQDVTAYNIFQVKKYLSLCLAPLFICFLPSKRGNNSVIHCDIIANFMLSVSDPGDKDLLFSA